MSDAHAATTFALETIRDMLIEDGIFSVGVRDQVKELRGKLVALESFLVDAIARKHEHESVRNWVSQAKRLAYRAEDIIEEYAIKVASKQGGGFRKVARRVASVPGEGTATHEVGKEISKIKKEITNLIRRLETYGINRIIAQPSSATIDQQRRQRTTYAHEVDEYFVGINSDVSMIVRWVTEDDMIHRVISISGIPGIGKTTIARKVFNHIKKSSEISFECFAWISVTQQFQVKILWQDIVFQITGEKVKGLGEEALCRMLYSVLQNKKCFIVLDDIRKLEDWESLRLAFPILNGSSKILLTTRITEVAEIAHQDSRHEPKLLDDKDGWDLLTKVALNLQKNQGFTLPETVKKVGASLLHMCGGLPLAIYVLGGILRNQDSLTEWETVNSKFRAQFAVHGGLVSFIAISYADLPSYLRPCFLYMGCFRKDEEIDITRLYQMWVAEGFIPAGQKGPDETLMDVASDFVHELISRNMVQPLVTDEFTDKKYCRLHDLMRELCLTMGKEEEFLEFNNIRSRHLEVGSVSIDGVNLCRQTVLVDNDTKITFAKLTGETCCRALILNGRNISIVEGAIKFKRLRSLILDDCRFKDNKLPKEIKEMIHLRYLSLRNSLPHGKLPAYISDLQYMQILNVSNNDGLQLPNMFHKMKRLRCLYLPSVRVESKSRKRLEFHDLNELEVVEGLDSNYDQFPDLLKSVNLWRLEATIRGNEELSTILDKISSLLKATPRSRSRHQISVELCIIIGTEDSVSENRFPDVKKLLLCCCVRVLKLHARIGEFPRYEHQFWPDLVSLKLWETKFEEDPMPFLQELPNLRTLDMRKDAYVGKEMYCSSKAFPKLTELEISSIPNIEKWRVDAGAFPNLQSLQITSCGSFKEWRVDVGAFPNLETLRISACWSLKEIVPDGLTNITSLTEIDMDYMPEEFRNKYGSLPSFVR